MKSVGFRCAPSSLPVAFDFKSIMEIVRHYKIHYKADTVRELNSFRNAKSLNEAIRHAGMAKSFEGKRFPHQWRLTYNSLQCATDSLLQKANKINSCQSFEDLYEIIKSLVFPIKGIGELYVYDSTIRIGAHLNLFPKYVYIHAGTRTGAKALGLSIRKPLILIKDLPTELQKIPAWQVEDILCIYKDKFELAIVSISDYKNRF